MNNEQLTNNITFVSIRVIRGKKKIRAIRVIRGQKNKFVDRTLIHKYLIICKDEILSKQHALR
jgi:hypothetical protein